MTEPCEALYVLHLHLFVKVIMRDADLAAHLAIRQLTGLDHLEKIARTG